MDLWLVVAIRKCCHINPYYWKNKQCQNEQENSMRALIPLVILLFAFTAVSALAKQPPSVVTCPCIERFVNYWFIGERSPQHWGCSGRRFKSCRPDQLNKKATFQVAFLFNRQDGSFEGRALGSQITPAAEFGQGATQPRRGINSRKAIKIKSCYWALSSVE